jgi:hypothetical protein
MVKIAMGDDRLVPVSIFNLLGQVLLAFGVNGGLAFCID